MHRRLGPAQRWWNVAKSLLSPKNVADAIGASESSLRRWIDGGRLRISRTAGGHRRIELAEALRFIRESDYAVLRPEVLGLACPSIEARRAPDEQALYDALAAGDRALARGLVISWFTSGRSLASIFDGPFRTALHRLGELWKHDRSYILVEHRATDICIEILHHLRSLLPVSRNGHGVAIGGTPGDEWHSIPSLMASIIVMEAGMRDINYGASTPIDLLASAAKEQRAKIVWLSFTMPPPRGMRARIDKLATRLYESDTQLILGGQQSAAALPSANANVLRLGTMAEFASLLAAMPDSKRK